MNPLFDKAHSTAQQSCYLAGPMRGYPEYNFPAFHAAAAKLRGHGLIVWSPAENDVHADGFDPTKQGSHAPLRHYMKRDLPAVLNADMVCVLPGWEKSQGAQLEVHVARECGIPVYWAENMQPVAIVSHGTRSADVLPDCMMPDGAEPCLAFRVMQQEWHKDRARAVAAETAVSKVAPSAEPAVTEKEWALIGRAFAAAEKAGQVNDELRKRLGLALPSSTPLTVPVGESLWLIETSELAVKSDPTYPQRHYWTGDPCSQWCFDPLKAARYPTREAAEHLAEREELYPRDKYPVCEHLFQCGVSAPSASTRSGFSLAHLQKHLPWTIPYSAEFEASAGTNGLRRVGHDVLHVMKSLGRIAAEVEAADHNRPRKLTGDSLAKEAADLVLCALHIARCEGFDLERAVVENSEARNAASIPPEMQKP